ncbi:MAG: diguanylate cyclase [Chloroflexota bacterium]|nr:diguanylate cyclase [Chloroflexota bacterium]
MYNPNVAMKSQDPSDRRILFADQDIVLCASARRALQREGFVVVLAYDGADALDRFRHEPFDLVVAGAALPVRNGLEVLREIKKSKGATPVILVGDASSEQRARALAEGAFAFLAPPVDKFEELTETIDRALALPLGSSPADMFPASPLDHTALLVSLRALVESTGTKPLTDTLQLLLEASVDLLSTEHAIVLLMQPDHTLQLFNALGFSDREAAARDFAGRVGDAFAWRVASERRTLIEPTPTVDADPNAIRFVGTPLIVQEQVVGVLVVYPLGAAPIDPARLPWLETLAAQGSLAVELARLGTDNERLSPSDPLTGVLKRSVFLDLADHEFRRSWRYNQAISAIIVDIDGMREINARGGREFGDYILRQVANLCRNTVRSIDLVGRYENDSFALLLLMTERNGVRSAAERLRAGIGSIKVSDAQGPLRVTATLGVCTYPREDCASIFDFLLVTQEAQRAARRSGANQTVYA